jgi:hypothetical protein
LNKNSVSLQAVKKLKFVLSYQSKLKGELMHDKAVYHIDDFSINFNESTVPVSRHRVFTLLAEFLKNIVMAENLLLNAYALESFL